MVVSQDSTQVRKIERSIFIQCAYDISKQRFMHEKEL